MERVMYKRFKPVLVNPSEEQLTRSLNTTTAEAVPPGIYRLRPSPSWRLKPYIRVKEGGKDSCVGLWQKDQQKNSLTELGQLKPGELMYVYHHFHYKDREILIITGAVYVEKDPSIFRSFTAKILSIM